MTDIYPFTLKRKIMNAQRETLARMQHEILLLESQANSLKNERDKVLDLIRKKRALALQIHEQITTNGNQTELNLDQ